MTVETELRYLEVDIERQFKGQREYIDQKFAQLLTQITAIPSTPPPPTPDFKDPRQWQWVLAGVIGALLLFIVAIWLATGGLTK